VEPLARGGMASVWIADDPVLSRRVAVKILREDLASDPATRTRFRNEAIAAARLNHPNVVATYDTGDDGGTAYIVMELIDGPTVRQLLQERGPLPVREVIRIGIQIADALEAAHRAGIVHRDVKPPNVLVPPAGPVKVTDFGIAKAGEGHDLTRTGTVMGTARYLAPEQVNGRPTDARTDVYALGLLLYEMLCDRPPFGGDSDVATAMARLTTSAPPIRLQRPDVPPALDDIVHRCMARDPARRFPSASAVRTALAAVRTNPQPVAPPPAPVARPRPAPSPPKARRPAPRRSGGMTWFWVGVVFVLAIAAGVAAFIIIRDDQSKSPSTTTSTARHLYLDGNGNRGTGGGARFA
jgi:serine/threonine-protein kinase